MLLCTTVGHLGILISFITDHLRDTVKTFHRGRVTVELWVGKCPSGHALGDAYTGWHSVSRIMIEEVSRAQS